MHHYAPKMELNSLSDSAKRTLLCSLTIIHNSVDLILSIPLQCNCPVFLSIYPYIERKDA